MKIAVTGSSGLIGSALVHSLATDGHDVRRLVRHPPSSADQTRWQPGVPMPEAVSGCDAVVNLAGAGIGDRRWSAGWQAEILASRVDGTTAIAASVAAAEPRPRVLLSASAVGWYGDTGGALVDESAAVGEGWTADVVRRWEAATTAASEAGVRVAHLRSGIVLARRGGALGRVLPIFRLGLGGRLGSGRQWMSWMALADEVAAIRFLLEADVAGPVNLVSPQPVTNADYTAALGRVLGRPAVLPVPGVALRLVLGGLADDGALGGQRVRPGVLEAAGFSWSQPTIGAALRAELSAS